MCTLIGAPTTTVMGLLCGMEPAVYWNMPRPFMKMGGMTSSHRCHQSWKRRTQEPSGFAN